MRCVEGDEEERRGDLNAAKAHLARVLQTEAVKTAVLAEAEERRRRHNMEGELEGELGCEEGRKREREGGWEGGSGGTDVGLASQSEVGFTRKCYHRISGEEISPLHNYNYTF